MDGCRKSWKDGEWKDKKYRRTRNNWRRISEQVVTEMQRGRKTRENREMKRDGDRLQRQR